MHVHFDALLYMNEGLAQRTWRVQVDTLSAQVSELTDKSKDVPMLETALEKVTRQHTEAEQKLHLAVNENLQIQEQVCNSGLSCSALLLYLLA